MKMKLRWLVPLVMVVSTPVYSCESELSRFVREANPHKLWDGFAYPVGYEVTVSQDEVCRIEGRAALLLTHASAFWDKAESTAEAVRKAVGFAHSQGLPAIGLVSRLDEGSAQFYGPEDLDHIVGSDGGAHRLSLPATETVFFAGGQLSLCLGESIRETLRNQNVRRLVLISDAIFDYNRLIFRLYRLADAGDLQRADLLGKLLTGGRSVFGKQLSPNYQLLSSKPFTFEIFGNEGKHEATLGDGPRKIEVHVLPTRRLAEVTDWTVE